MDDLKAVGTEHLGHLLPHPDHIMGLVSGAVGVALRVGVAVGLGVGLAAVGVQDQNLGSLPHGPVHTAQAEHVVLQFQIAPVIEVHPLLPEVAAAVLALAGHAADGAVVRRGSQLRLLAGALVLRDGLGLLMLRVRPLRLVGLLPS